MYTRNQAAGQRGNSSNRRGNGRGGRRGRGRGRGRGGNSTPARKRQRTQSNPVSPGSQPQILAITNNQLQSLNNTIMAASNGQSNSTIPATVNTRKISVDLCIGNYKKYLKNFQELEKLNAQVKAPRRTQFVPSETNSFLANKLQGVFL